MAWHKTALICLVLLLAACGQQAATVPTQTPPPTVVPTTEVPSATPVVRGTLPPSWTLAVSLTPSKTPTPTITPTPTSTYTPSLTFTPSMTFTITNTPTPNATNQSLVSQPLAAVCATFAADPARNPREFAFSTAPTVVWTPVDTAVAYLVRLFDGNRSTLVTETTTETAYTFPADLFTPGERFSWEVAPLDGDGVQICPSRGAALFPSP